MQRTRRSVLTAGAGLLGVGGIAGCIGSISEPETQAGSFDSGYAAFFALWDWAEAVSGSVATFENPVETGSLGHGWEPPGDLVRDIAAGDVFIYVDSPAFAWAQRIATTLENDYGHVALIDVLATVDEPLLEWEEDEDGHDDRAEDDDPHDHPDATIDPHIWVDPILAQRGVDAIADGFAAIDPDNEGPFRERADSYKDALGRLDEDFTRMMEAADRSTAVLAGHESFRYLERRYGFDLHSPVGVAPDAEAGPNQIRETIAMVDDLDIDVILYERFESRALADSIVQYSEATETAPLSALAGTTPEWDAAGWGYIDQMREVNLPSLRRAFGSD